MLTVTYTASADPWLPVQGVLAGVRKYLSPRTVLHLLPRSALPTTFERELGAPFEGSPYQLRAWALKSRGEAWVFVDETETRDSVLWVLLHELAHLDLVGAGLLQAAVTVPRTAAYDTDEGHEADPEERLANQVATAMLGKLTGCARALDRRWWRRRVCQLGLSSEQCGVQHG